MHYLGLLLFKRRLKKEDWLLVLNKFERKLGDWQAKLLSQGGQFVLMNSVLSNLPLYYLSVFRAPKWVIQHFESLRRAYFRNWRTMPCSMADHKE